MPIVTVEPSSDIRPVPNVFVPVHKAILFAAPDPNTSFDWSSFCHSSVAEPLATYITQSPVFHELGVVPSPLGVPVPSASVSYTHLTLPTKRIV